MNGGYSIVPLNWQQKLAYQHIWGVMEASLGIKSRLPQGNRMAWMFSGVGLVAKNVAKE